jgi:FtsP/CotA-like multicopper oxidase with cupredoxin domain
MGISRRDLLRWGMIVGGAAMLPDSLRPRLARADDLPRSPQTVPFIMELKPGQGIPSVAQKVAPFNTQADPGLCVNVDGTTAFHVSPPRVVPANTEYFLLHERPVAHSFHPQLPKNILWGYDGSIPGPTIVSKNGTPQLIRFVNDLPVNDPVGIGEPITVIHRHGGFQAPQDDGYPLDTFCTGQSRDYFYPNRPAGGLTQNLGSTLWYHDHAIDITGPNVYRGLAGFNPNTNSFDTGDEATGLQLPANFYNGAPVGPFDIGLVFQDRRFNREGYLLYNAFDHDGFIGDKFCVNGLIQPYLKVKRRKYRFRFLNGSNARVYQFFLSSGQPFVAIGTDSNLLPQPVTVQSVRIGPAERVDVVIDFTNYQNNSEVFLVNRLQQTDGRKPDGLVSPGTSILKFLVDGVVPAPDPSQVPATLLPVTEGPAQLLPEVKVQRRIKADRSNGAWTINGQFFDENRISARPRRGEPEIWILESGGGWVHPVHIHLSEFFILSRDGKTPLPLLRGRKDTVLIGGDEPRETRILIQFDEFTGRYVFHCHNVEHEDMRMMAQFEVQP